MKRFLLFIGLAGLSYWVINNAAKLENSTEIQTKLIQTDTSEITRIIAFPKPQETDEIVLNRTEAGWVATKAVKNILVAPKDVQKIMEDIATAKLERVVGKYQIDSPNFGLGKTKSRRVQLFAKHLLVADIVIGFSIPEPNNSSGWITYFRYKIGKEVYEADGKFGLTLAQPFESFFDKTIADILPEEMEKLVLVTQDTTFVLKKSAKSYFLNEILVADSLQVQVKSYLQNLAITHQQITKADFLLNFDEIAASDLMLATLNIYGVNRSEPIEISLFFDSTAIKPFIIHSSLNKDTYFASDSAGLYQTIFQPFSEFTKAER